MSGESAGVRSRRSGSIGCPVSTLRSGDSSPVRERLREVPGRRGLPSHSLCRAPPRAYLVAGSVWQADRMTAQAALRAALRDIVGPAARAAGFRGSGSTWRSATSRGDWAVMNVQSSSWSTAECVRCVINPGHAAFAKDATLRNHSVDRHQRESRAPGQRPSAAAARWFGRLVTCAHVPEVRASARSGSETAATGTGPEIDRPVAALTTRAGYWGGTVWKVPPNAVIPAPLATAGMPGSLASWTNRYSGCPWKVT